MHHQSGDIGLGVWGGRESTDNPARIVLAPAKTFTFWIVVVTTDIS